MESLLGNAANIIPIAGTFQAMNDDDDRRVLALPQLPVAMCEQAGFRIDLKQPGFGWRDIEAPRHKSRDDSHGVAVCQKRMRIEGRDVEIHMLTVFHEEGAHKTKSVQQMRSVR